MKNKIKEEIDDWIKECDVDGRMIVFEFFDSDIQDLKNCIKRDVEKGRKQALEEVEKMIDSLPDHEYPIWNEDITSVDCISYYIDKNVLIAQIKKQLGENK